MFIEYDEAMSVLFHLAIEKDYEGLFDALEALEPNDPKVPFVLGMIESVSGLSFTTVK